eukprot:7174465-Prymnesium_polylepis.1
MARCGAVRCGAVRSVGAGRARAFWRCPARYRSTRSSTRASPSPILRRLLLQHLWPVAWAR